MDKARLLALRDELQAKWDELSRQRDDITNELVKLQGEYRGYDALIAEIESKESGDKDAPTSTEPDSNTTA